MSFPGTAIAILECEYSVAKLRLFVGIAKLWLIFFFFAIMGVVSFCFVAIYVLGTFFCSACSPRFLCAAKQFGVLSWLFFFWGGGGNSFFVMPKKTVPPAVCRGGTDTEFVWWASPGPLCGGLHASPSEETQDCREDVDGQFQHLLCFLRVDVVAAPCGERDFCFALHVLIFF